MAYAPAGQELPVLSVALALTLKERVCSEQDVEGRLAACAGRELRSENKLGGVREESFTGQGCWANEADENEHNTRQGMVAITVAPYKAGFMRLTTIRQEQQSDHMSCLGDWFSQLRSGP